MSELEPQSKKPTFPWPESMGGVSALEPQSAEMMAYDRAHVAEYIRIADELQIPIFARTYREQLTELLRDKNSINLIEAVARLGNYGCTKDHESMRKAVSKLLDRDGIKLPRGKRTRPGMLELVADLTPIFLFYGLPLATGELSRLVTALRIVAEAVNVASDPRDELRRLTKGKKDYDREIKKKIIEAVKKGLESLKVYNPP